QCLRTTLKRKFLIRSLTLHCEEQWSKSVTSVETWTNRFLSRSNRLIVSEHEVFGLEFEDFPRARTSARAGDLSLLAVSVAPAARKALPRRGCTTQPGLSTPGTTQPRRRALKGR